MVFIRMRIHDGGHTAYALMLQIRHNTCVADVCKRFFVPSWIAAAVNDDSSFPWCAYHNSVALPHIEKYHFYYAKMSLVYRPPHRTVPKQHSEQCETQPHAPPFRRRHVKKQRQTKKPRDHS